MDFYRVIRTQRTITKFKNGNFPKNKMLRILQAANLAPSSSNRQPWNFLIVKKSSMGQMKAILSQSYEEKVRECEDLSGQEKKNRVDDLKEFYRTFGGAPITIVVYVDKEMHPSRQKNNICDASSAINNLILAAWSEGIGSYWISGLLNEEEAEIRESLRIPEDKEIIGIIPIGIPAHRPKGPPKEDIRSKVKWFGL
jgi:nitroreductase